MHPSARQDGEMRIKVKGSQRRSLDKGENTLSRGMCAVTAGRASMSSQSGTQQRGRWPIFSGLAGVFEPKGEDSKDCASSGKKEREKKG